MWPSLIGEETGPRGALACGSARCAALWKTEWATAFSAGTRVAEFLAEECAHCSRERRRRRRVAEGDDGMMAEIGDRFADALYIHPFNVPKSRILTMRAANAAARAGKQLLWVVAKDVPSTRDDEVRSVEGLTRARERWLLYPEMKTAGMPGLLPLYVGMPVQFTDTVNFEFGVCKRATGVVDGWALSEADASMVREVHAEAEVVLREVPVAIHVKLHGQAKVFSPGLPPGVFPLKPKTMSWDRSDGNGAAVKRTGFTVAPHFASTAHAVTGATLPTAVVDLLDVARTPRADDVPPSYVALSRVRTADDILIVQAFPPALFRMGHQRGPWLLSSIVDGSVTIADAGAK